MNQGNFKWDDPPSNKENPLMWRKSHHYLGGFLSEIPTSYHRLQSANHLPSRKSAAFSLWIPGLNLSISCYLSQTCLHRQPHQCQCCHHGQKCTARTKRALLRCLYEESLLVFSAEVPIVLFFSHLYISHLSNFVNAKQSQVAEFVHISVSSLSSLWNSKKIKAFNASNQKIANFL